MLSMASNYTTTGESSASSNAYPISIVLATLSLAVMLLIIPPMFWHFRNRNIGATSFVFWLIVSLFFNFLNALLWPSNNLQPRYSGAGLCDFEIKLQAISQVALPASFACTLRALAAVLNTDSATLVKTSKQRRRACAVDLSWCIGFPLLQTLFQYIVQSGRYYVFGVAGCRPMLANSWLTVLLIYIPPAAWACVDSYFAIIILIRLCRYRLTFSTILASSGTTKSRFIRLYLICILWIFCAIPSSVYAFVNGSNDMWRPFDWAATHESTWTEIVYVHSDQSVNWSNWVALASGVGVFVLFGFGKEAVAMYKAGFVAIGLGWCFSSRSVETPKSTSSLGDKAKLLFKRKELVSTSTSWSSRSSNSPFSPVDKSFTETLAGSASTTNCSKDMEKGELGGERGLGEIKAWEMISPTTSSRGSHMDIALEKLTDGSKKVEV